MPGTELWPPSVNASKAGRRRWCSDENCGSRIRVIASWQSSS
ncbi:CGNR zinc finger domain-containing protein [Mesorhizobium sp. B3-1-7]|nr:CGNR zinc finger domain-containing protein [Mesorhizobium sp. B3-1-7]TPJ37117.1 CGNR zinc finger domain-containing protein [Mesorhizobium sp. B2-8-3]